MKVLSKILESLFCLFILGPLSIIVCGVFSMWVSIFK